jgi:hypothetical protein
MSDFLLGVYFSTDKYTKKQIPLLMEGIFNSLRVLLIGWWWTVRDSA